MGYKSIYEMTNCIKDYGNNFLAVIPDNFTVHSDYLRGGLTGQSFCNAYHVYQHKMQQLQFDMHSRPADFGLIAFDKKGAEKPAYSMANQYVWLFLALGQSGELKDDKLAVDGSVFDSFCTGRKSVGKNETNPKNIDKLLDRLGDHGFTVSKKDGSSNFTVSSDTPDLMRVIKSSVLSPYARTSMTSDYPTFNWRIYKFGIDEKVPFEETYTYGQMTPEMKNFSSQLIKAMANEGWKSYIFFPHSMHGGRLTFPTVEYYYSTSGGTILFRCNGTKASSDFMDSLSDKFAGIWKESVRCKGCRKDCNNRITGEYFGRKGTFCKGDKVRYNGNDTADLPDIIKSAKYAVGNKM